MNSFHLHGIIEHIRSKAEFPFDVEDIDENLPEVLAFFDICEVFDKDEMDALKQDLRDMALEEEANEAVRLAVKARWVNEDDIVPVADERAEEDLE